MTYLWLSLPPLTSSGFKMDCTETMYWLDFGCNLPGMLLISAGKYESVDITPGKYVQDAWSLIQPVNSDGLTGLWLHSLSFHCNLAGLWLESDTNFVLLDQKCDYKTPLNATTQSQLSRWILV